MTRTTDPGVPCSGPGVIRRMFARESLIVWVLLVALAIRVLALLSYGVKYNAAEDAQGYFDSAAVLAHTGKLTFYGKWPSAITMPGFVALLSVPIRLTQDPTSQYLLVKAVLILLSLASVYIVYLLGQRIGGTPTGLLAAGLLSVSPASIYVANATYVENGVMPVVLLLILLVIRMADEPTVVNDVVALLKKHHVGRVGIQSPLGVSVVHYPLLAELGDLDVKYVGKMVLPIGDSDPGDRQAIVAFYAEGASTPVDAAKSPAWSEVYTRHIRSFGLRVSVYLPRGAPAD